MARKKYLWSKSDAADNLIPFCVLECGEDVADEIRRRFRCKDYDGAWKFIADNLHERYPNKFPSYFDDYNRRRLFWYNNVLESYETGYERMIEEEMEILGDNFDYDNDEALREDAERQVDEELEDLPVYVIE